MPISLDSARTNELKIRRVRDATESYGNVGQILEVNPQGLAVWNDNIDLSGFITNPLTADIFGNNFSIIDLQFLQAGIVEASNFFVGTVLNLESLTDAYPLTFPNLNVKYLETIITGAYNRQPVEGTQENFDNINGFPTELPCQMSNGLYTQAINGVISRVTGITLAPNFSNNYLNIGQQTAFQDRCVYDPLNMRYDPTVPNAWTAIKISSNLGPSVPEPIGARVKGILIFHTHLEGTWSSKNTNNVLKVFIRHYRGLGVFLRDYQLSSISGNGIDVVRSDNRYLMGHANVGEDIENNDYFEVWLGNDPGSVNPFDVTLFKIVAEWKPCP